MAFFPLIRYNRYYQYQKKTNINYNEYDGASAYFAYQDAHGGRKLSRYNFELIDCDVCTKLDCLNELAETEEDTILTGITNYVAGLTACQATKAYFLNTYQLYAGFMCNEDGSGVDIALFMDPACSVYNSIPAYKTFSSAADQILMYNATDLITYPFLNSINCNGDYAYLSMDEYRQQLQNYNYNGNSNNNNNDQVNQYCTALFEGGDGGQAVSLKDCNQDGVQDVEGANETVITYNDTDYPWYEFILSQEDMQSTDATCQIIDKMQGKYQTIYKWSGSGQNYDYGTGPQNSTKSYSAYSSYFSSNYNKMDSTLIAAIIVAVLVAFTAFCCILYSCCCTPNKCGKTLDRKKIGVNRERLVDPKTGILM